MISLLRCRRGSVAFATVIALVPLIGVVALGAEAGSWYVTKQHAQNAADSAAISGVWRLICTERGSCTDAETVDYRGKQFASQNAFCHAGDTTAYPGRRCVVPPTGTSQAVQITVNGNLVTAKVSQQQPANLAAVLGLSTVDIGATATAQIKVLSNPCILALNGPVSFQGSPSLSSANCGAASNSTASNAFSFTGSGGISVDAPMFSAGGCSQTGGSQCTDVNQHAAPVPNPLSGLDAAMALLKTSDFPGGVCPAGGAKAYETNACVNQGPQSLSGTLTGTYYFNSGAIDIGSVNGTATLILFGTATWTKITGNPTIQLTAPKNPAVPPALSSVSALMIDLLIYDSEITAPNKPVTVLGNSSSFFNGIVYVPNSPVTYGGNSSVTSPGCFQVIAKAVEFSGNTKLDNSKCISDGAKTLQVLIPRLVPS